MSGPIRVGICGFAHEVNAFADPVTLANGIDASQRPGGLAASWEAGALVRRLHELGSVEIVELPTWEFGASGPLDARAFRTVLDGVTGALGMALAVGAPLDAVVVLGHGAGRTSDDLDPDATFLEAVRSTVGAETAIVVVLDFHANLSGRMVDAADVLVGYRTNPHVDIEARLVEAAEHVHRIAAGAPTSMVWCRVPMLLPQIAQLTSPTEPLGEVFALAEEICRPPVRNVSVFGGFSLSDVPDNGMSVCVTVDAGCESVGVQTVTAVADAAWSRRDRYRLHTVPLADAVREAQRAAAGDRAPVLMADTSDNPGGGAPGNSPFILRALLDAGVAGVVIGLQCDRGVVEAAWAAGLLTEIEVEFNAGSTRPLAPPLRIWAKVIALVDVPLVPTRGVYAGSTIHPGRCCALQIAGIHVGVSTYKVQCADDDTLRHVGLRPDTARVVVVKSRGHFRAGFDHLFADDQIIEVGAPGVATNDLWSVDWQHRPHPMFPLDPIDDWTPAPIATARRARPE